MLTFSILSWLGLSQKISSAPPLALLQPNENNDDNDDDDKNENDSLPHRRDKSRPWTMYQSLQSLLRASQCPLGSDQKKRWWYLGICKLSNWCFQLSAIFLSFWVRNFHLVSKPPLCMSTPCNVSSHLITENLNRKLDNRKGFTIKMQLSLHMPISGLKDTPVKSNSLRSIFWKFVNGFPFVQCRSGLAKLLTVYQNIPYFGDCSPRAYQKKKNVWNVLCFVVHPITTLIYSALFWFRPTLMTLLRTSFASSRYSVRVAFTTFSSFSSSLSSSPWNDLEFLGEFWSPKGAFQGTWMSYSQISLLLSIMLCRLFQHTSKSPAVLTL